MEFWEVVIFTAWDEPSGKVYYFSKRDEAWAFYRTFNNKYWWKIDDENADTPDLYAKIYHHELDKYNVDDIEIQHYLKVINTYIWKIIWKLQEAK